MESIKKKYKYEIYDGDDLSQQAYIIAIEEIMKPGKYDPAKGPIFNFLSLSVKRRIFNYIRYKRYRHIDSVSIDNIEEETIKIGNMRTTNNEFWEIIDENLKPEFRLDYIKMKQGVPLQKTRKDRLIVELQRIVNEYL